MKITPADLEMIPSLEYPMGGQFKIRMQILFRSIFFSTKDKPELEKSIFIILQKKSKEKSVNISIKGE